MVQKCKNQNKSLKCWSLVMLCCIWYMVCGISAVYKEIKTFKAFWSKMYPVSEIFVQVLQQAKHRSIYFRMANNKHWTIVNLSFMSLDILLNICVNSGNRRLPSNMTVNAVCSWGRSKFHVNKSKVFYYYYCLFQVILLVISFLMQEYYQFNPHV